VRYYAGIEPDDKGYFTKDELKEIRDRFVVLNARASILPDAPEDSDES
jgi:hypothetical protein